MAKDKKQLPEPETTAPVEQAATFGPDLKKEAATRQLIQRYLFAIAMMIAAGTSNDPGVGAVAMQVASNFGADWDEYVRTYRMFHRGANGAIGLGSEVIKTFIESLKIELEAV